MPAIRQAVQNTFQIIRTNPDFSGVNGLIDMRGGPATRSGQKVDERGSLRVAAVWIAVTVLADEVGSLALRLVQRDDQTRTPQKPPRLEPLWGENPNPDQTRVGIEATLTLSEALWGYSAQFLGWTQAGALSVRWPIDPSGVSFERTERGGLRLSSRGGTLVNEPGERPQFAYNPMYTLPGDIEPVSPVRMAAELAGLSLAYEETSARLMGRGLNPSALITADVPVSESDAREISGRMEQLYGGAGNAGRVAVVGGKGVKFERLTMSMADAQMLEQYDAVFKMLLAIWRVPPTVAGMVDKPSTWGTGVAEFSRGLERFTLRPIIERRQAAYQKFITGWVDPSLQVRYRFDSLLSASPKDRAEIQRTRLMAGMTSTERVLAQEDEPPFGADETVFSQLAMAAAEDRELARLKSRAETYGAFIRAGVTPEAAARASGFDPEALEHSGNAPTTVQGD